MSLIPWDSNSFDKAKGHDLMKNGVQCRMSHLPLGFRFYDADADRRYYCKSDYPDAPRKIVFISPFDADKIRARSNQVQVQGGHD